MAPKGSASPASAAVMSTAPSARWHGHRRGTTEQRQLSKLRVLATHFRKFYYNWILDVRRRHRPKHYLNIYNCDVKLRVSSPWTAHGCRAECDDLLSAIAIVNHPSPLTPARHPHRRPCVLSGLAAPFRQTSLDQCSTPLSRW